VLGHQAASVVAEADGVGQDGSVEDDRQAAGDVVEDDGQAHVRIVSYLESLKVV